MNGPNPITYSEIDSFARLTGATLRPHEIEAIMLVDGAYRGALHDFKERQRENAQESQKRN